jgi:hypothetical protein
MRNQSIGRGEATPDLSIITINWNTSELLEQCIESMYQNSGGLLFEIAVIDNASEGTGFQNVKERFSQHPEITWIENDTNVGGLAENQPLSQCRGRYLLLLGSDVTLLPGALQNMVEFLDKTQEAGAVTARLLNPDMSPQNYYFKAWNLSMCFFSTGLGKLLDRVLMNRQLERFYFGGSVDSTKLTTVEQAPGACFMLRWEAVNEDYIVDERFPFFFNDADLCKRIYDNGYKIFLLPQANVIHDQSAAFKKADSRWRDKEYRRSAIQYFKKYHRFKGLFLPMIFFLEDATRFLHYSFQRRREPKIKTDG